MSWAMGDEAVKVQMFRFVDVLPMLRDHTAISRHLDEYFEEVRDHLPWAARVGLDLSTSNTILSRALAFNARTNAARMARRFIAGSNVDEVLASVRRIRRNRFAFTLDLLGEAIISDSEADRYQQAYIDLIKGMSQQVNEWPEDLLLDCDHEGSIPASTSVSNSRHWTVSFRRSMRKERFDESVRVYVRSCEPLGRIMPMSISTWSRTIIARSRLRSFAES